MVNSKIKKVENDNNSHSLAELNPLEKDLPGCMHVQLRILDRHT